MTSEPRQFAHTLGELCAKGEFQTTGLLTSQCDAAVEHAIELRFVSNADLDDALRRLVPEELSADVYSIDLRVLLRVKAHR
ncbi:hypothetical protein K2Z84_05305 [Candidatus Binatia bacterium]|nr:hypothetical protein [Candidatus Binatia bacterium]